MLKYKPYDYNSDDPNPQIYQDYVQLDGYDCPWTPEKIKEKFGNQWEIQCEENHEYGHTYYDFYIVYWITETEKQAKTRIKNIEIQREARKKFDDRNSKMKKFMESKEYQDFLALQKQITEKLNSL